MRILRIFKMVRHFTGLQSLIYTLRQVFNVPILKLNINQAWRELGLILIIVLIIMLMFSSLLFAFERDGEQNIIPILYLGPSPESWGFVDCIWWVIGLANFQVESDDPDHGGLPHAAPGRPIHMLYPHHLFQTMLGQAVCGLCALSGIFILTLPIPIVVTSFAVTYKSKLWRNEIAAK